MVIPKLRASVCGNSTNHKCHPLGSGWHLCKRQECRPPLRESDKPNNSNQNNHLTTCSFLRNVLVSVKNSTVYKPGVNSFTGKAKRLVPFGSLLQESRYTCCPLRA